MERIAGDYLSEKLKFFLVCTRTVQRCLIATHPVGQKLKDQNCAPLPEEAA
jgi:hypothetical protein